MLVEHATPFKANNGRLDNYTWVVPPAERCPAFVLFDRSDFCRLLGGRDVLLIGDSMTRLTWQALWNLAAQPNDTDYPNPFLYPYARPINWPPGEVCQQYQTSRAVVLLNWAAGHLRLANDLPFKTIREQCPAGGTAVGCRGISPAVVTGSTEDRIWGVDEFVVDFVKDKRLNPSLVIVNAGLHFQPDDVIIPQYRAALSRITTALPHAIIVVRNTPPGHANCSKFTAPLAEPQHAPLPYGWRALQPQNILIADLVEREFPSVLFMDVATSTALRGDMHVSSFMHPPTDLDCVHYVEPGPVDSWIRIHYNTLLANEREGRG